MAFTNKIADMRHTFERDLVRRKGIRVFSPGRHDIMGCVDCGEDFDQYNNNQERCSLCQIIERRRQKREWKQRNKDEFNAARRVNNERPAEPWTNLMVAVVEQAATDGDTEWLEENKETYTRAILGRSFDGQA